MTDRITIKTKSAQEGMAIYEKIRHLVMFTISGDTEFSFEAKPGTDLMELAKLLEVPKQAIPAAVGWDWADAPRWADQIIQCYKCEDTTALYWFNSLAERAANIDTPDNSFQFFEAHPGIAPQVVEERPAQWGIACIDEPNESVTVVHNAIRVEWPENDAAPTLRPSAEEASALEELIHNRREAPGPDSPAAAYAQQNMYSNSIDLATQMAWLEGLSVVSECTGQRYCEVMDMANHNARVRYDPIGRPAIRQHLIEKYCLDLHWLAEGECVVSIFGDHSWSSRDFGCCLGSAIVSTIINAQKAK